MHKTMEKHSMQMREIEYIAAVSELGSFSKAAEKLFVSQPALSQSVQRLEDKLGVKLLNRASAPITLTDAGRQFMEQGYEILSARDMIYKKMTDMKDMVSGSLTIGISQFYGKYYISRLLPLFNKQYPGIKVHITEEISSVLETMILQGRIDFGIFSLPIGNPKIHSETIFEEELLFAVPNHHPMLQRAKPARSGALPKVELAHFKDDDFIMVKEGQRLHTIGMELCRKAGFEPKIVFESRNTETVNAFIAGGMGVGFIPEAIRKYSLPEHRANYFHLKGMQTSRSFVAAYNGDGYLSRAAKACIAFAKECSELQ